MLRRLAPVVVLVMCLLGASAAEASTLSREGTVIVYTDTDPDIPNNVFVGRADGTEGYFIGEGYFITKDGSSGVVDAGSGCEDNGGDLFRCTNVSAFRIEVGGGDDEVRGDSFDFPVDVPMNIDLGGGNNFAAGGTAGDNLRGGPGGDNLIGFAGPDTLDGGFGADGLDGGADGDLVTYASRAEGVSVDFGAPGVLKHGSSNDGPPGGRDAIQNVETVVGGSGNDTMRAATDAITFRGGDGADSLTGSSGIETLYGGNGADTIDALGGADTVLAGAGVDSVEARDAAADIIDCGPDSDTAAVDAIDDVTSCGQDPPPPGPPEPTVIIERFVVPSRVLFDLSYTFSAGRGGTTLRNLFADVEPGAAIAASCRTSRGRRCSRTRDLARSTATASRALRLRGFEGKRLPVGARLSIRVTKPGTIGAVKTLTIRRRRAPSARTQCLPPGAASPTAC